MEPTEFEIVEVPDFREFERDLREAIAGIVGKDLEDNLMDDATMKAAEEDESATRSERIINGFRVIDQALDNLGALLTTMDTETDQLVIAPQLVRMAALGVLSSVRGVSELVGEEMSYLVAEGEGRLKEWNEADERADHWQDEFRKLRDEETEEVERLKGELALARRKLEFSDRLIEMIEVEQKHRKENRRTVRVLRQALMEEMRREVVDAQSGDVHTVPETPPEGDNS
jgi:hypothetical protein